MFGAELLGLPPRVGSFNAWLPNSLEAHQFNDQHTTSGSPFGPFAHSALFADTCGHSKPLSISCKGSSLLPRALIDATTLEGSEGVAEGTVRCGRARAAPLHTASASSLPLPAREEACLESLCTALSSPASYAALSFVVGTSGGAEERKAAAAGAAHAAGPTHSDAAAAATARGATPVGAADGGRKAAAYASGALSRAHSAGALPSWGEGRSELPPRLRSADVLPAPDCGGTGMPCLRRVLYKRGAYEGTVSGGYPRNMWRYGRYEARVL